MGKPMSWQWKLTLACVILLLVFTGWVFTDGCHDWVIGQINMAYAATPKDERRDSPWAQRFLYWAGFKGAVCGDYKVACGMYKEFCGLPQDYSKRALDYVLSPQCRKGESKTAFVGKCSPDGLTGWGPLHPDAPDAYYSYLTTMEPNEAGATTGREAKVYFILFYTWHIKHSPDHLPHPKFKKYWDKIRQKILDYHVGFTDMDNFDAEAKKAAPWKE